MVPSYLLVGRNVELQTLVEAHAQRNRHLRNFMNHAKLQLNNENVFLSKTAEFLLLTWMQFCFRSFYFVLSRILGRKLLTMENATTISYVVIIFNNYDQAKVDSLKC